MDCSKIIAMTRIHWQDSLNPDSERLRYEVFTLEQGFKAEDDVDEVDGYAHNLVLYEGDVPIATARLFLERDDVYHLGRLCIKKEARGKGLGSEVLAICADKARELGGKHIRLGAQYDKTAFYIKNGYRVENPEPFDDAGYPHIHMIIDL